MTLNLRDIRTPSALHAFLQEQLQFPAWYGANWDAFWDSITALVSLPAEVRLVNWQSFADANPRDMLILRELLQEYAHLIPSKQIVLV